MMCRLHLSNNKNMANELNNNGLLPPIALLERRRAMMSKIATAQPFADDLIGWDLVSHWVGTDAPVSDEWVDRIGGIPFTFANGYVKSSDGYRLENSPYFQNKWGIINGHHPEHGKYYFAAYIDCDVNVEDGKRAMIIDIGGAGGAPSSHASTRCTIYSDGTITNGAKYRNTIASLVSQTNVSALPLGQYVNVKLLCLFDIVSKQVIAKFLCQGQLGEIVRTSASWGNTLYFDAGNAENNKYAQIGIGMPCFAGTRFFPNETSKINYKEIKFYTK